MGDALLPTTSARACKLVSDERCLWCEISLVPGRGPDLEAGGCILISFETSLVFLSFSLSIGFVCVGWFGVCCLTFVLLVGLWVFTFSLSLLFCAVVVGYVCALLDVVLLVSFPLIPFPCFNTCLSVWFSQVVFVSVLLLLLTLWFTDLSVLLL